VLARSQQYVIIWVQLSFAVCLICSPQVFEEGSKTSDRWLSKLRKGGAIEDALLGEEYEAFKRV
jgi:hypothetical protein